MTIEERKQCDGRENEMWERGFRFGWWLGVVSAVSGAALVLVYEFLM